MIVVGIDPGQAGGIAVLGGPEPLVYSMPMAGGDYDVPAIYKILRGAEVAARPLGQIVAFVERCATMPSFIAGRAGGQGNGGKANWWRGNSSGTFRTLLAVMEIRREVIAPQTWQDELLPLRGGSTKARSILQARKLFPGVSLYATARSRKESDGLSDALLLAEFGRRRLSS